MIVLVAVVVGAVAGGLIGWVAIACQARADARTPDLREGRDAHAICGAMVAWDGGHARCTCVPHADVAHYDATQRVFWRPGIEDPTRTKVFVAR